VNRWLLIGCVGLFLGTFTYIVYESKAPSYLSVESKTCANCHVMLSAYNTWSLSSHRENANCVDCHIPHENIVRKYAAKAADGGRHAAIFTTGTYPEVIRATDSARSTVQQNCVRCHEPMLLPNPMHNADLVSEAAPDRTCWECHRNVPHGLGNSISTYHGIAASKGLVRDFPE